MKLTLLIIFTGLTAAATPDQWVSYRCDQKCGLTESTPTTVSFSSTVYSETLRALDVLCDSQQMKLQKQPSCVETNYDKTKNENFQRCRAGIGSQICMVSVSSYENGLTAGQYFNSEPANSFDKAETQAMAKCRSSLNDYSARCLIYSYYTQY